ncbi:MAG TPA: LysM peptidoglycan-binding domain-containing M23 family metallopeptidase [Patescibacteria group bacterium]|nr:LysM peptidoglycan-binding domain-containing M23 family metallopeptidase [Patescibacteria group bacterium]
MTANNTPHRPRHAAAALAVLTVAGLLTGCVSNGPIAPVDYREGILREHALPSSGTYTVLRGDTIYGVARQFNVSVRALIDANQLQPPFQLTVGQILTLGNGGDYTVVKGDTLLGVSRRSGVPFSTLARMNNLSAPFVLKVGQRLKMPAANGNEPTEAAAAPLAAVAAPMVASTPLPPPPKPEYAPVNDRDKAAAGAAAVAGQPSAPAEDIPPVPPVQPPPPAAAIVAPAPPAQTHLASAATPLPPAPPKSGRGFVWPVHGQVIGEFGSTGKGQHNDGINIAVARGTSVVAADDGVVAYSGNELRGFGNLLLIKHADGWMTAYAHNDSLLVKRGETVKRGQQIAKAGDSGGVSQPQVHFEVRQGTRAVDPMTFLRDKSTPTSSPVDPPDPG